MDRMLFRHIKHARSALTLTIICGILATIILIAQMTILSRIVSGVFISHVGLTAVAPLLLLLGATIVVRAVFAFLREVSAQEGAARVKSELREQLFAHLLRLGPAFSRSEATGELVATANAGVERLDAYISRYLPQIALSIFVPLLIAGYVLSLDWISAILLLITGPVIPLLMMLVGSYAETHVQRQWTTLSRMSAHFLDAVQGLPTLKLFGRSEAENARIGRISNRFRDRTLKMLRIAFLSGLVLELLTAMAIGLIAVTLGVRLINGGISFEVAFLILLLTPEFYRPLRELGVQRHAGMEGKAAARRIVALLETPITLQTTTATRRPTGPLRITFAAVTYTYPGSEQPALNEVHLELPANTCTALIGRSGAGKSTLVQLLMRFIDPQAGQITVNGIPLTDMPAEVWREHIALVPQRPYIFYGSVMTNIRLARPDASDEEVTRAAEIAGAASFIEQLPAGYATEVGEQGTRLSAGQAQRIAIARAFLRDAPLLILDESTSSLDPESETLIRRAIDQLARQRTVLVIAHRYNTIASSQQIAVMDQGKIIEVRQNTGLSQDDLYKRLMGAQRTVEVSR